MGSPDVPLACGATVIEDGLDEGEVLARREQYGANTLPEPRRAGPWRLLAAQMTHLLAVLLWIAAGLAAIAGMPALAAAIAVIVVLNAVFAFWQEYHADRSAQRLRALLPTTVRVVRSGTERAVDAAELVVGDVVHVQAGDRVAADLRVTRAASLALDESMLTGESTPVAHTAGDRLMSGTFVVQGDARARVEAVGRATTLAGISRLSEGAVRPSSPLTRQLNTVVRVVAAVAFTVGASLGLGAVVLGLSATDAFLFGVGVSVALVPEGLLPTVTLSLARGAQRMAAEHALVRRLDAVETLGATTFICTDKTGTLTQNRMNVVAVVTPGGRHTVDGAGYEPVAVIGGTAPRGELVAAARAALDCVTGRAVARDGSWVAVGDPLEAALHALALRVGVEEGPVDARWPFTTERMISSAGRGGRLSVLGAPEAVLARCRHVPGEVAAGLDALTRAGLRVLAVAGADWSGTDAPRERDLELLGLLGLQDPPRKDVAEALASCRTAGIRVAMLTGDHPETARAVAEQVGLLRAGGIVVEGRDLPSGDADLADLLDSAAGAVVARVTPADKLRIAGALRSHGHVVAMTGDGVNDAPALRAADVGVAMGASGSDVAREAADLVLLDDHFATVVGAIQLGRATTQNVRRFLTYHLTDNVAELAPFALWALSGGNFPLALSVLQVLALDIGTDMLPALALGGEPARSDVMRRQVRRRGLIDRALAIRAFLVLGMTEAVMALGAFTAVLLAHGWRWGETPGADELALASGTAFATIACMQIANAFACRSTRLPVWRLDLLGNRLVLVAVAAEAVLLLAFVGVPPVAGVLGGDFPHGPGWVLAMTGALVLLGVDGVAKGVQRRRRRPG